jgi:hypothetical protein
VSYLTKTDVKIAIKAVWDIGRWILRGANPMEPFEGLEDMYEDITVIEDDRIPKGYTVTRHELRGYDSPDKWHEVSKDGQKLVTYGRGKAEREKAIKYCINHTPKELGARFEVLHVNECHQGNHWIVLDIPTDKLDELYEAIKVMKEFNDDDRTAFWCLSLDVAPNHPYTEDRHGNRTRKPSLLIEEAVNE